MATRKDDHFVPTRAVVLSELSAREKEKYYALLINSGARFYPDHSSVADGPEDAEPLYVANVRVLAPGVKREQKKSASKDGGKASVDGKTSTPPGVKLSRLQESGGHLSVTISGVKPFNYSPYIRFVALIAHEGAEATPKVRILSWAMKMIEELYDARFAHEKSDVERDDDKLSSSQEGKLQQQVFPVFIYKQLTTLLGLRHIIEQNCWDLVYNVDRLRLDYLEVEIFGRFLQEFYDQDDLLFFLYVRSVIASTLHINFRGRWSKLDGPGRQVPQALWMSQRECNHVAKIVFGSGPSNDALCKDFLALITPHMVGQKTEQSDSRRIDITQFLHLAVVGYHQTQGQSAGVGAAAGAGAETGAGSPTKRFSNYAFQHATPAPAAGGSLDSYLNQVGSGAGAGAGAGAGRGSLSLAALATTPIQPAGGANQSVLDVNMTGAWSASPPPPPSSSSSSSAGGDGLPPTFTNLAEEREREFLGHVCEPLNALIESGDLGAGDAEAVLEKMIDMLRLKVCFPSSFALPLLLFFPPPPSTLPPHSLTPPTPRDKKKRCWPSFPAPAAPPWTNTTRSSSPRCGSPPCWKRWRSTARRSFRPWRETAENKNKGSRFPSPVQSCCRQVCFDSCDLGVYYAFFSKSRLCVPVPVRRAERAPTPPLPLASWPGPGPLPPPLDSKLLLLRPRTHLLASTSTAAAAAVGKTGGRCSRQKSASASPPSAGAGQA